jgi:hypothetical protein
VRVRVLLHLVRHFAADESLHLLQAAVLANELEGCLGANSLGGLEVIAPEEDAQFNKLRSQPYSTRAAKTHLIHGHIQLLQDNLQVDLRDGHLLRFAEREMTKEDRRVESESVHVLGPGSVDLSMSIPSDYHLTLPALASSAH